MPRSPFSRLTAAPAATLALLLALSGCSKPPPPPPAPAPVISMGPVPPAKICAQPKEKQAFDVTGLKIRLMVAALVCGARDDYNAFVLRNRSDLVAENDALHHYFVRAWGRGRSAQSHMDSYKTDLANVQQQRHSRDPQFCPASAALFRQLATASPAQIGPLAGAAHVDQPIAVATCQ